MTSLCVAASLELAGYLGPLLCVRTWRTPNILTLALWLPTLGAAAWLVAELDSSSAAQRGPGAAKEGQLVVASLSVAAVMVVCHSIILLLYVAQSRARARALRELPTQQLLVRCVCFVCVLCICLWVKGTSRDVNLATHWQFTAQAKTLTNAIQQVKSSQNLFTQSRVFVCRRLLLCVAVVNLPPLWLLLVPLPTLPSVFSLGGVMEPLDMSYSSQLSRHVCVYVYVVCMYIRMQLGECASLLNTQPYLLCMLVLNTLTHTYRKRRSSAKLFKLITSSNYPQQKQASPS